MRRLSRRRKLLFAVLMSAGTLLACELGARGVVGILVGPRVMLYGTPGYRRHLSFDSEKQAPLPPSDGSGRKGARPEPEDARGGYTKFFPGEIRRDTDEHGNVIHATINESGFRGESIPKTKAPGVVRVATLGASSTFGYLNRDEDTYPRRLERLLERAGSGDGSFEVVNLGIPHLTSDQIRSLFLAEALPLEPDVVTLYAGMNDSHAGFGAVFEARRRGRAGGTARRVLDSLWGVLRNHTILGAFADSMLSGGARYTRSDLESYRAGKRDRFLENVGAIHDACRERGIVFIVANQQAASLLVERDRLAGIAYGEEEGMLREILEDGGKLTRRQLDFLIHAELMRDLEDWAKAKGVPFVDVIEAADGDRDVLLSWVHLNPEGNRLVAEAFAREILARVDPDRAASAQTAGRREAAERHAR